MAKRTRFFFGRNERPEAEDALKALKDKHPELEGDDINGGTYIKIGAGGDDSGTTLDDPTLTNEH